jgi:hypothetical protein
MGTSDRQRRELAREVMTFHPRIPPPLAYVHSYLHLSTRLRETRENFKKLMAGEKRLRRNGFWHV